MTILFCDLVESTSRFELADPEDVRTTLGSYHSRVQREIERFGGTVEKFIGDAVMAVYGVPAVHEDDPERAVFSALRILPAIEELNEEHPETPLAVRIGVETGEAFVDLGAEPSRQGIVFGGVVNTAARLQTAAPIGGILVGEATYQVTKAVFDHRALDPVTVKGKAEPLRVWLVVAAKSRFGAELRHPSSTPWVDRVDELELTKLSFARSVREASVQLVTLLGEPGVGKSRLVLEFFGYVDDRPEVVFWREGRCLPYGEGVTFWALGEVVKAQAGILASDGATDAAAKLADATSSLISDPAEREWVRARLAPLIGLPGIQAEGADRIETFSAWRRFLETMAAIRPLVLVFEDVHWADPAMLAFVEHVMEWSSGLSIFVICTARPELFDRNPGWGGGKRNWSTLSLMPLDDVDARDLVAALLPPHASEELQQLVVTRTGGNPLFAEEFVRMLGERPDEHPVPDGRDDTDTPASIHAIIAARLDTLAPRLKTRIQDASVIGRVFWAGAVGSMGLAEASIVHDDLHELARKELVRPSTSSTVKDEAEFSFWHTLIRDVAYGQIPRARRAPKHIAVAEWIEGLAGERVADHAELLAHHYGEALRYIGTTQDTADLATLEETTRKYWMLAGERAMSLDIARAADCFDRALALTSENHPQRARLLRRRAGTDFEAGRTREAQHAYEEALAQARRSDDRLSEGVCLERLSIVLWEEGDSAGSRRYLAQAVEVLESEPHGPELADCYSSLASEQMVAGHFDEAFALAERALALLTQPGNERFRARALSFRGVARCYRGDLGGIDDLHAAISIAERQGSAREQVIALLILAEVHWAMEGPSVALLAVDEASELASRRGLGDFGMACQTQTVGPLFDLGRWDELVAVANDVIERSDSAGNAYDEITAELWKSQVLLWRGEKQRSISTEDLMISAREIGDAQVLVPAVVVAASIALIEGRTDEAARYLRELEGTPDVGLGWYREQFLPDLVRLCVATGDIASGERLLHGADAFTERHRLSTTTANAVIRESKGALNDAASLYREVADGWASYGHQVEEGRASLGEARCLIRSGLGDAEPQFARARAIFEQLGATVLVEETATAVLARD